MIVNEGEDRSFPGYNIFKTTISRFEINCSLYELRKDSNLIAGLLGSPNAKLRTGWAMNRSTVDSGTSFIYSCII